MSNAAARSPLALFAVALAFQPGCGPVDPADGEPMEDVSQVALAATAACKADLLSSYYSPYGAWTTSASSLEDPALSSSYAFDSTQRGRWSSAFADNQWVAVDLKGSVYIDNVEVFWEAASGKRYDLQTSSNGSTWTTVASVSDGGVGPVSRRFNGLKTRARYFRLYGYTRTTPYGFSTFEIALSGDFASSCDSSLPICGNGVVESGEQCDDNNTLDDNACSASCQIPTYRFEARHSAKVLDLADWSTANGAKIQQWTYGGGNNQKWTYTISAAGWQIKNQHSGKCLDVAGPSTADGAKVHQWDCHSGTSQIWNPVYQVDGLTFVNAYSGKCLDVSGVSTANGAALQQWTCKGTVPGANNQKFDVLSN
jgi:cysteine-rich repeat protein